MESIRLDPLRFLHDLPTPVTIDEAQLLPDLTLWIKRVIDDRAGMPGQFILTGSARLGRDHCGARTIGLTPARLPSRSILAVPLARLLTP